MLRQKRDRTTRLCSTLDKLWFKLNRANRYTETFKITEARIIKIQQELNQTATKAINK